MLTNDNILRTGLGYHNYPTPTLDPCTSIITNSEDLDRFNNVVDDICQETITKATTIPTRPAKPVPPPREEVGTPTNTGNDTPLKPRKVAFTDLPQDIQQRLTHLAVNIDPASPVGHTSCPDDNSSRPRQNTEQGNITGRTSRPTENSQRPWHPVSYKEQRLGSALSPQSVSSIGQQTNQGNSFRDSRSCFRCGEGGNLVEHCTKSVRCEFCRRNTHSTEACCTKTRTTSTPRDPTEGDDEESTHSIANNTAEQSRLEIMMKSQMELTTKLNDKEKHLKKIKEFDGRKEELCVTWIEHNRTAAKELSISLRKALLETSTDDVYEVIAMAPEDYSESDLISYVLENFSDIPTREDAEVKLRSVRRTPTKPLLTYNVKYAAIHLVAMGCEPRDQVGESTWRNYANTLDKDLAHKLNKDIGNHKGCHIHNLQDVMDRARNMEFKERTNRLYRNRKETDDATQIKEVNEIDYDNFEEINQLQTKFEPKFNSTMKPKNNSFGSQSSGYQSGPNNYQQNRYPLIKPKCK